MTATEILKHEHKIVILILDAAKREAQKIQDTGQMDAAKLEKILEFFKVFIDQCHHGKEEEYLFPKMQEKGLPSEGGPIGVMLAEHDRGRQRVKAMGEALARAKGGRARLKRPWPSICAPTSSTWRPTSARKTTCSFPWPTSF